MENWRVTGWIRKLVVFISVGVYSPAIWAHAGVHDMSVGLSSLREIILQRLTHPDYLLGLLASLCLLATVAQVFMLLRNAGLHVNETEKRES
ncbi:MAG: hypothetical protein OEZ68_07750 [Gammaproteobacteria bacterium]|nr:hypothetical protein [Gammaproteobacteria bacterium]MDH5800679.1 hypothetical protein [Gammaproteobacteria bacterium]